VIRPSVAESAQDAMTLEFAGADPVWRSYRVARNRPLSWVYAAVMTAIVMANVVRYGADEHGFPTQALVETAFWTGVIGWFLWMSSRVGVDETDSGLISHSTFRNRVVAWDDIESFGVPPHQLLGWTQVCARCRSGRSVTLSVSQGKRVVWQGGETLDIESVLTERLEKARSTQRP
jgi:hypothetical protein